jgi:hypothetical protein
VKVALSLAILAASAVWADEAADRAAVEATVAALNTPPVSNVFTADFPNTAELQRFRDEAVPGVAVVVSKEPMGEATWHPAPASARRFVTRSVTFVAPDTAVVVATYGRQSVLFVVRIENSNWRIASFHALPEAQTKVL